MAKNWSETWSALVAEYERLHPRSRRLDERAQAVLPGGDTRSTVFYLPFPVYIDKGEGCRLYDVDGGYMIDFLNNYTSMVLGHAHPAVVASVREWIVRGQAFGAGLEAQVTLAEEICSRVPSVEKVRFCNSGTEATLFAIRAARAHTGKDRIVKMEGGYHGTHDAAEVSTKPSLSAAGPAEAPYSVAESRGIPRSVLGDVVVVPFNDLDALERAFKKHKDEIAGVIVESFLGAGGVIEAAPGYLQGVRSLCDRYGMVFILDEIQSLRLAPGGAQEYYGVKADLTAMGKIIGGGFPVGAFGGRDDIMAQFSPKGASPISHGGTFNGNLATMVAGLVTLKHLTKAECDRLNALGERLKAGFQGVMDSMGLAGQVTGVGSILNVHFTKGKIRNYRDAARADRTLPGFVHLSMINKGIFSARRMMFSISTPMTPVEVDKAISVFQESMSDFKPTIAMSTPELLV